MSADLQACLVAFERADARYHERQLDDVRFPRANSVSRKLDAARQVLLMLEVILAARALADAVREGTSDMQHDPDTSGTYP